MQGAIMSSIFIFIIFSFSVFLVTCLVTGITRWLSLGRLAYLQSYIIRQGWTLACSAAVELRLLSARLVLLQKGSCILPEVWTSAQSCLTRLRAAFSGSWLCFNSAVSTILKEKYDAPELDSYSDSWRSDYMYEFSGIFSLFSLID